MSLRISVSASASVLNPVSTLSILLAPRVFRRPSGLSAAMSRLVVDGVEDNMGSRNSPMMVRQTLSMNDLTCSTKPCALVSKHALNASWHRASVGASGHRCCARW